MGLTVLVPGVGGPANLAAGPPLWPSEVTAWGTLAVAIAAVAVALFAEWRASVRVRNEREHSDKILVDERERADKHLADEQERHDKEISEERRLADERLAKQLAHSDAQLAEERAHSAAQLREERDHAEEVRRRERQADNARILLQRVVELQPYLDTIPGMSIGYRPGDSAEVIEERGAAVQSLRHGAMAEVPLLSADGEAKIVAERYRQLVQLIHAVANDNGSDRGWLASTLKAYARWVRITLRMLAENQTVPPIHGGSPEIPLLGIPADQPIWQPNPIPPGWNDELDAETAI
jgi:hypothetical protein